MKAHQQLRVESLLLHISSHNFRNYTGVNRVVGTEGVNEFTVWGGGRTSWMTAAFCGSNSRIVPHALRASSILPMDRLHLTYRVNPLMLFGSKLILLWR